MIRALPRVDSHERKSFTWQVRPRAEKHLLVSTAFPDFSLNRCAVFGRGAGSGPPATLLRFTFSSLPNPWEKSPRRCRNFRPFTKTRALTRPDVGATRLGPRCASGSLGIDRRRLFQCSDRLPRQISGVISPASARRVYAGHLKSSEPRRRENARRALADAWTGSGPSKTIMDAIHNVEITPTST